MVKWILRRRKVPKRADEDRGKVEEKGLLHSTSTQHFYMHTIV